MSDLGISCVVFAAVFSGALLGAGLRRALPDHHLSSESREAMKLALGLIGTMAALVLGLMVASAKSAYDTQQSEITQMSAKPILLDLFIGFGLLAPSNLTVLATLLLCAVCVSSSMLLILAMDRPFNGLIRIADAPVRSALEQLGK